MCVHVCAYVSCMYINACCVYVLYISVYQNVFSVIFVFLSTPLNLLINIFLGGGEMYQLVKCLQCKPMQAWRKIPRTSNVEAVKGESLDLTISVVLAKWWKTHSQIQDGGSRRWFNGQSTCYTSLLSSIWILTAHIELDPVAHPLESQQTAVRKWPVETR